MKQIIKNFTSPLVICAALFAVSSCTLDPKFKDPLSEAPVSSSGAPTPPSLSIVYEQLNQLSGNGNWFSMEEQTTDEMIEPTRGTDWDDFGTNRKLHLHSWDASHDQVNNTWNGFNGALFLTTLVAETASGQPQAEAKFLRAYFSYLVCDLYGQVQHRPATAPAAEIPAVFTRSEAIDYIISELESIKDQLPGYNHDNRNIATKEAAEFLLAKCYLNKAVFKQDVTNPAGPFTFDAADMNKVIEYCNDITSNPNLSLSSSYWDNFKWDNGTLSTENIFVRQKSGGLDLRWATFMGFHYNMAPSGWNGFCTLSDFYSTFNDDDARKGIDLPGYTDLAGARVGFLIGQQRGPTEGKIGNPVVDLKDRSGNPLVFTPDVSLYFSTETKGIRTNKYPMDPATINDGGGNSQNEFVMFRLSDVLLMKAEAILRGGNDPMNQTPLSLVNSIRTKRGTTALGSVDLDALLAERGRELYCEGWRRNDLVRFEKFNQPVQERPDASDPSRVVFPIPNIALSSNPNLSQNFGY
jgi:hypothetical protein